MEWKWSSKDLIVNLNGKIAYGIFIWMCAKFNYRLMQHHSFINVQTLFFLCYVWANTVRTYGTYITLFHIDFFSSFVYSFAPANPYNFIEFYEQFLKKQSKKIVGTIFIFQFLKWFSLKIKLTQMCSIFSKYKMFIENICEWW